MIDTDVDGFMFGQLNEWMGDRWVSKGMSGYMDVQTGSWRDEWVERYMDNVRKERWADGWMIEELDDWSKKPETLFSGDQLILSYQLSLNVKMGRRCTKSTLTSWYVPVPANHWQLSICTWKDTSLSQWFTGPNVESLLVSLMGVNYFWSKGRV